MLILCLLIGAILGVVLFEIEGLFPGLLIGYLVYHSQVLRKKVDTLNNQVTGLQERIHQLSEQSTILESIEKTKQPAAYTEEEVVQENIPEQEEVEAQQPDVLEQDPEGVAHDQFPEPAPPPSSPAPEPAGVYDGIRAFILQGNWPLRAGIVIVFLGLSFFVNWAIEKELFPLELRLTLVAITGAAMVFIGSRLVNKRPEYGYVMEGAGLAVLYLTIFASFRLYGLLAEPVATGLLMAVTLFGVLLGLGQNAQWVAVVSMLGGFLVPVLISNEEGSHVALFSYYAILNMGILGTAWYKAWRYLNLTGFVCTFAIGTIWGGLFYEPEFFASIEPFLILFFVIYLMIGVLYTLRHEGSIKNAVDGTLVFGLPVVVFALQASLVEPIQYGISISCAILGLCYLGTAHWLRSRKADSTGLLIESFDGIGIALFSLFIPFLFDTMWTGIGWAIEGAALAWLGIRQKRVLVRVSGFILVLVASLAYIYGWSDVTGWGYLFLGLALLFTGYQVYTNLEWLSSPEKFIGSVTLYTGLLFWLVGGGIEIEKRLAYPRFIHVWAAYSGITAFLCTYVGRALSWQALVRSALFNVPVLGFLTLFACIDTHPFEYWLGLPWVIAFVATYVSLYIMEPSLSKDKLGWAHAAYVWMLAIISCAEGVWLMEKFLAPDSVWPLIGSMMLPVGLVLLITYGSRYPFWPLELHKKTYLSLAVIPVLIGISLISIGGSFENSGDAVYIGYLPVLNPLDILLGGFAFAAVLWYQRVKEEGVELGQVLQQNVLMWSLVALVFIWLNATIARTVHHWTGVPYNWELWGSSTFQATLSICWTLLAVTTMAIVARKGIRTTWIVAASLLAVVVVKLFVVDLSALATLPRIISFIGVGILMLVIGYIAPVPPKKEDREAQMPDETQT